MTGSKRLLIPCLLFAAQLCLSQTSNQGAIVGTVTDPTAAVIPSVRITVTNTETNVTRATTSNRVGEYLLNFLVPGKYRLTAEATGFQAAEITDIVVSVGQLLRTDVQMRLGVSTPKVTVSAAATPLNVDTASRGGVIGSDAINNLPLNGREWIQLAALIPGAESGNVKAGTYTDKGVEVSFNGARDTHNSFYVDGADSTDANHNTLISSPALDAIKEFRVETNMFSTQYGRSGGAVILAVTNSGTNTFHGSLYEYHRNKWLDASPPFATLPKSQLPNYLFNQFGGSVGGPIWKNKAFFFFSMEKFRQVTPGSVMVTFAPSAAEAAGDVSNTINPYTNEPVVLRNPFTGEVIPSGILPANLISPVGRTLMDIWSQYKPNYDDPFVNLRFFRSGKNRQDKYLPRIDYNLNSKNSIFGTWDENNYNTSSVYHTVYGDQVAQEYNKTLGLTFTHTFTPNLVNDLKFSRTWDTQGTQFVLADQAYGVKWGMYEPLNAGLGSPRILMYTVGYATFGIGNAGPVFHQQRTLYSRDDLVWSRNKHTFHFGGDFRRENFDWSAYSGQTQDYFGLLDGLPGYENIYGETGSVFTDLLTAAPNLMTIGAGGGGMMPFSRNAFAGYVQDDWKVTSRLTLNLGVRYDYEAPFGIDNGEFLSLDFATGLPQYCKDAPKDLLAIMTYKFETGGRCQDHKPDYHDVSPRVGFAFRPFGNNRTVIRGGYGLFYNSENAYNQTYGSWVQPFAGLFSWSPGSSAWQQPSNAPINPLLDGMSHFTTLDQKPYGLDYVQGQSMGFFFPTVPYYPTSYMEQYNLTLGNTFGGTWVEVAYVGSHGINLSGPSTVANYDPTLLAKIQAANPELANFGLRAKGFSSHYDALQASARKELSHGVYFIAAYTWSHAMADMSNDDTNETLLIDTSAAGNINTKRMADADFDVRQRLTFTGIWDLPFGRGKSFGNGWSPMVNSVLGGWQLNTIATLQGGFPFTVYDTALHFPDRVCNGSLPRGQRTADRWFDISCFPTHVPTVVTDPVTGLQKIVGINGDSPPNALRGPGTDNWDIGTQKNFRFAERFNLQFRGEFFNAFNHMNLQAPSGNYFFNSPSGAKITRAASLRDIQLVLRLTF